MNQNQLRKLAGLPLLEGKKAEYQTAAQGEAHAKKDHKDGWVDDFGDEKSLRRHLEVTIAPSKEFTDAYVKTLKDLVKVTEAKTDAEDSEEADDLPAIVAKIALSACKKFGIGDPKGGESADLTAMQEFLSTVYDAGVTDGIAQAKLNEDAPIAVEPMDANATRMHAHRITDMLKDLFHVPVETEQDPKDYSITLTVNNGSFAKDDPSNPHVFSPVSFTKAIDADFKSFRSKGWTFTQPIKGRFKIGVPKKV